MTVVEVRRFNDYLMSCTVVVMVMAMAVVEVAAAAVMAVVVVTAAIQTTTIKKRIVFVDFYCLIANCIDR